MLLWESRGVLKPVGHGVESSLLREVCGGSALWKTFHGSDIKQSLRTFVLLPYPAFKTESEVLGFF